VLIDEHSFHHQCSHRAGGRVSRRQSGAFLVEDEVARVRRGDWRPRSRRRLYDMSATDLARVASI
jgi:hypothetical protein